MPEATLPRLTLHHGSSALAMSQDEIQKNLPTTMTYDQPLTIHARPKTDLWRKPPSTDTDNAPTILISTPIDLHRFHSARVTVSGNWSTPYDQGGLVLFLPDEDIKKWVKTGIEFVWGKPYVGTVATSRWSDWSLVPLEKEKDGIVTIQVERQVKGGERVESLWVYIIDEETGEKEGIRQITWWFEKDILGKENSKVNPEENRLLIGVYAARPKVPEGEGREHEELVVKLEGFEVKLFDD